MKYLVLAAILAVAALAGNNAYSTPQGGQCGGYFWETRCLE